MQTAIIPFFYWHCLLWFFIVQNGLFVKKNSEKLIFITMENIRNFSEAKIVVIMQFPCTPYPCSSNQTYTIFRCLTNVFSFHFIEFLHSSGDSDSPRPQDSTFLCFTVQRVIGSLWTSIKLHCVKASGFIFCFISRCFTVNVIWTYGSISFDKYARSGHVFAGLRYGGI